MLKFNEIKPFGILKEYGFVENDKGWKLNIYNCYNYANQNPYNEHLSLYVDKSDKILHILYEFNTKNKRKFATMFGNLDMIAKLVSDQVFVIK